MPLVHRFRCPLPNGVHARPAAALAEQARQVPAEAVLVNERNGLRASLQSVLGLVAADIRLDDPVRLEVSGPEDAAAMAALQAFLRNGLARFDELLPAIHESPALRLPPTLRDSAFEWWPGQAASGGIGRGRIVAVRAPEATADGAGSGSVDSEAARRVLEGGLEAVAAALDEARARAGAGVAAQVLEAQRSVARDPELRRQLLERVGAGSGAVQAIAAAEAHFTRMLKATGSALLRERALDVQDVCRRLRQQVTGEVPRSVDAPLEEDAIVLADELTPGQLLALDRRLLQGLLLRRAGATSHTVILARSFRIPVLVAVALPPGLEGRQAILDAELGLLAIEPDDVARRHYARERARLDRRERRLREAALLPGLTRDGQRLEVGANISAAEEAALAFASGAEGIGVFRTEMLFARRTEPPGEEAQLAAYRQVLEAAGGRSVFIRALDAGGDKPIPYLHLPVEPNPFLGRRGVRVYPTSEPVFREQVRALVRASALGPVRLLLPMVSSVEEVRWVKSVVAEEREAAARRGLPAGPGLPLAVMIETPACAFGLSELAREADFFSIGTNDLLQYFFAAERGNPELAALADPLQPAFLRLLRHVVDELHARGKWVGVCGEMAGDRRVLPLLVGLGLDEISLSPPGLGAIKAELRGLAADACRELLASALECATAAEVAARLAAFDPGAEAPVTNEDLLVLDSESRTKAEALRELADLLFVLGRADDPRPVEDALWLREAAHPTAVGDGIALPHCATADVRSSSLALLRLRQPVPWGTQDDAPVRVVLMLALRAAEKESHLRLFSRLARRLAHDEFRRALLEEPSPTVLGRALQEALLGTREG